MKMTETKHIFLNSVRIQKLVLELRGIGMSKEAKQITDEIMRLSSGIERLCGGESIGYKFPEYKTIINSSDNEKLVKVCKVKDMTAKDDPKLIKDFDEPIEIPINKLWYHRTYDIEVTVHNRTYVEQIPTFEIAGNESRILYIFNSDFEALI